MSLMAHHIHHCHAHMHEHSSLWCASSEWMSTALSFLVVALWLSFVTPGGLLSHLVATDWFAVWGLVVMHGSPPWMKEASAANAFKVKYLSLLRTSVDWLEEWWGPHSSCSTDPSSNHMHQLLIQTCFSSSFTAQMYELSSVLFLPLLLAHKLL